MKPSFKNLEKTSSIEKQFADQLERIGNHLTNSYTLTQPNADVLISYHRMVRQLETILSPVLTIEEEKYRQTLSDKKQVPNIDFADAKSTEVRRQQEFYNAVSAWQEVLLVVAFRNKIITKGRKNIVLEDDGEET